MKLTSMKSKIVGLIVIIGVALGSFVAYYAPHQAESLGTEILINDTRFISKLLSENLSLGMETFQFDNGAALDQTLSLLKSKGSDDETTISNVWVYNQNKKIVTALYSNNEQGSLQKNNNEFTLTEDDHSIHIWSPMYDSEKEILGYVDIEFTKAYLLDQAAVTSKAALFITIILVLLVIGLGLFTGHTMTKPVMRLTAIAEKVSQGDIDCDIDIKSNDEIGILADSFRNLVSYMKELSNVAEQIAANNLTVKVIPRSEKDLLGNSFQTMVGNLSNVVRQIKDNANQLASAAFEISSSSEQMSKGAQNQTEQMNQVSSAVERMTANVLESFENTGEATEASKSASETATAGGKLVSDTVNGMQKISDVVRASADSIGKLSKSADQIGEIISVIVDIADQTNLLALNAAIEAARAGEHGRGFAVVADEVRKLAERTGNATGEITNMIKGIQVQTQEAVSSMESGISEVNKGREMADKAGNSLNEIVNMSQRVMEMIQEMAAASEEQSHSAEQISKNVEHISSITKETATGAQQSASAAEELSQQAENMQQMVALFKID